MYFLCYCYVAGTGQVLAAELLLELMLQRGSLSYLLEWINMALTASALSEDVKVSRATFDKAVSQMKTAAGGDVAVPAVAAGSQDEFISLFQAAMCLMREVSSAQWLVWLVVLENWHLFIDAKCQIKTNHLDSINFFKFFFHKLFLNLFLHIHITSVFFILYI